MTRGFAAVAGLTAIGAGVLAGVAPRVLAGAAVLTVLVWAAAAPDRLTATLFALLFFLPVTIDPGYPVPPAWAVLVLLGGLAAFGRMQRIDPARPPGSRVLWTFLIVIATATAAVISGSERRDILAGLLPLIAYCLVAWHVYAESADRPQALVRLARALSWVGVAVAVMAVYQRIAGSWPVLDQLASSRSYTAYAFGFTRSAGVMGHPIVYGSFCVAMICVALTVRGRLWGIPLAANGIGLLLSGARSAWLGLAAALAVWYLFQERKVTRRGLLIAGGVVSVAAVGVASGLAGPPPLRAVLASVTERLTDITGSPSATARYVRTEQAWSGIWDSIGNAVFGLGAQAHVRFFDQIGISDGQAPTFDNTYLTMWYDFGLVGVLAAAGAVAALLLRSRTVVARMLVVAFLVQIWFFDVLLWPCAVGLLMLALALGRDLPQAVAQPVHSVPRREALAGSAA